MQAIWRVTVYVRIFSCMHLRIYVGIWPDIDYEGIWSVTVYACRINPLSYWACHYFGSVDVDCGVYRPKSGLSQAPAPTPLSSLPEGRCTYMGTPFANHY